MPRRSDDEDDDVPRRKKAKSAGAPWLWIGLGCGCFSLLGVAGIIGVVAVVLVNQRDPELTVEPNPKIKQMPGLIAYWSFDEASGNKVMDHSGRGNHARLVGARREQGVRGQALGLDNKANQYCEIPASNDFNFAANAPFTFAGWFKTPLQTAAILSLTSAKGPQQIDLIIRANKFLVVVGDDFDRNVQNAFVWSNQVNDGEWHHFAFTRRGNSVELYIDAVLQGRAAAGSSGGPVTTDLRAIGSERLWITTNTKRWGNPSFQGAIDEVCVFNRALEAAEVQTLFAK